MDRRVTRLARGEATGRVTRLAEPRVLFRSEVTRQVASDYVTLNYTSMTQRVGIY